MNFKKLFVKLKPNKRGSIRTAILGEVLRGVWGGRDKNLINTSLTKSALISKDICIHTNHTDNA